MMMNNSQMFSKLLSLVPEDEQSEGEQQATPRQHTQRNIIPPVGIAKPEILDAFLENIEDEDKIKRDVRDVEEYYKENFLDTAKREVTSLGFRALEGLGGSIGGLMNLLSGEAHFDENGQPLETEVPKLPSAHQLREITKEKTGKRYEPKNELSKNLHETATDIGSTLPLPGLGWVQRFLMPLMGQGFKAVIKSQGGTEAQGDAGKLAFMGISTIANLGNAPQVARHAYAEVERALPQGTRMSTRYMTQELNTLRNTPWYRTGRTAAKGPAFDEIERIDRAIQHGSMDVHDAMQIRRDINEARDRLRAFHYEPGLDRAAARQYLNRVDDVLRTNMERWGQGNNPQWLNAYERANEAYAVTRSSQRLQDYIQNNAITRHLQSETTKTLFHLGGAAAIAHAPALLGSAAAVGAGAKGIQLINRMIRSPILRNHYAAVTAAAAARNAGAMNNALQKFDEEAKKLEEATKNFKKK